MPNLYFARQIEGNAFGIAGGGPGMEVSWEVTAVRDHAIQPEVEKPVDEQGTYLYPQGHGEPEEAELDYQRNRDTVHP